jgi:nicotinamidase-related amidase
MTQALLLMDIQNGTVERFDAGDEYLDRVVAAQAKAENAGLLVVLVRVAFNPGHPEISMRNKTFSAFKESDSLLLGSESTEPHPRLIRGKGEAIVTKTGQRFCRQRPRSHPAGAQRRPPVRGWDRHQRRRVVDSAGGG